ncbi:MAG: hypothetical protein EOO04_32320, partial [Chitinophagaceae bacterium]
FKAGADEKYPQAYDAHMNLVLSQVEEAVHIAGHGYGLHPVIFRNRQDQELHLRLMEWGCIPYYINDAAAFARQRATMLNARSERILDDPKSYWSKIKNRRCLIPVTGFYEHRKVEGLKKKVPYLIQLKDQPLFFLPGLYSVARLPDKDGLVEDVWTFTVVTRSANKVMAQIHNDGEHTGRMPLMLPTELSKKWLMETLEEEDYRDLLNYEIPSDKLHFHTVYTIRSAKPRPDEKAKDQFYDWGTVPGIIV